MKFRRPPRFFKEMSIKVGRTDAQWKAKFQKFEKEIYTQYLGLPVEHFLVYLEIRDMKKSKSNTKNMHSVGIPDLKYRRKLRRLNALKYLKGERGTMKEDYHKITEISGNDMESEFKIVNQENEVKEGNSSKDIGKGYHTNKLEELRKDIIRKLEKGEIDILKEKQGKYFLMILFGGYENGLKLI